MDETLQRVRESVLSGLGELTDFFGFGKVMGQLYGALLMSERPLSLDELESIIGKSKASVSMNMRNLERWRMVHEVWVKGDRRKYYEAHTDLWKIVTYVLGSRELNDVREAVEVLDRDLESLRVAKPSLDEADRQQAEFYQERVVQLRNFFGLAQLILENFVASEAPPDVNDLTGIEAE
jgi:DNA-binding transcriptional regulator GbsR (MarR family)